MARERLYGYQGRALVVDLTRCRYWVEELDAEDLLSFIGGFGMNKILFRSFYERNASPLDPGNPVILGAGPFVGYPVPGACRIVADSRLPASEALSSCSGSMRLGLSLRRAGFDHMVILGRASELTVLVVEGSYKVDFLSATGLAGVGAGETASRLRRYLPGHSVLSVGPAGENLVHTSLCIVDGCSTLGRGGLGAVMGSKGLKAVCIAGEGRLKPWDEKALRGELERLSARRRKWPLAEATRKLGMMAAWPLYFRQLGSMTRFDEERERLFRGFGSQAYEELKAGRISCPNCFLPDKDELLLPGRGLKVRTTSFLNSAILGCLMGFPDAENAAFALHRLDELGLDFMALSAQTLFLWEMGREGLLGRADVDGMDLRDRDRILLELAERVARREGRIGETFALGWKGVKQLFGEDEVESRVPLVRDVECIYDPRISGLGTMEFEQILSPRGPSSASGGSPTYLPGLDTERLRHLTGRMGADGGALERIFPYPGELNVGRLTRYSEDWFSLFSSLGLCNRHQINRFYNPELLARLYDAVTGAGGDPEDLLDSASRAWGLYRELNEGLGKGKGADKIPRAWFGGGPWFARDFPVVDYFGRELSHDDVESLLLDYYDERSRPHAPRSGCEGP